MYIENTSVKKLLKEYQEGGKTGANIKRAILALRPGESIQVRREDELPIEPHIGGFESIGKNQHIQTIRIPRPGFRLVQSFEIVHRLGRGQYKPRIVRKFKASI